MSARNILTVLKTALELDKSIQDQEIEIRLIGNKDTARARIYIPVDDKEKVYEVDIRELAQAL
jgi:hypothetical protein